MKKYLLSLTLINTLLILNACSDNESTPLSDYIADVTSDVIQDTQLEDSAKDVNTLRGYFCESDRDCDESEICLEMSGITDRVCQPSAFVTFIDNTTFTIDRAELEPDFVQDEKGRLKPVIKGFSNLSSPGDPDIPSITHMLQMNQYGEIQMARMVPKRSGIG